MFAHFQEYIQMDQDCSYSVQQSMYLESAVAAFPRLNKPCSFWKRLIHPVFALNGPTTDQKRKRNCM